MLKRGLLLSISLITICSSFTLPAFSHSSQKTLEERVEVLEALINKLNIELKNEKRKNKQISQQYHTKKMAQPSVQDSSHMKIGKTQIKLGGFIDTDIHITKLEHGSFSSNSPARDFYIPGATPVSGTTESTPNIDFTAQTSRLSIKSSTPFRNDTLQSHLEIDFLLSPSGNEKVSNSFTPRIRHAYIKTSHWLIGQTWTNFMNLSSLPESASFLTLSDSVIFSRQPQIRYTKGAWAFSFENPDTTIDIFGRRTEADNGLLPDAILRYTHKKSWGNITLSGLLRDLHYETTNIKQSTLGWGISFAGRFKFQNHDDIRFSLTGGEGLGRYIALNAGSAASIFVKDSLKANASYGGFIAYRHVMGPSRINFGYSLILFRDNHDIIMMGDPNDSIQSAYTAWLWDVLPKMTLGLEALYGKRTLKSGLSGNILRFTFSTRYTF